MVSSSVHIYTQLGWGVRVVVCIWSLGVSSVFSGYIYTHFDVAFEHFWAHGIERIHSGHEIWREYAF